MLRNKPTTIAMSNVRE